MARTYGKAQDLIDFTRASSGTCLRRVKYGAELVTNGTFDSDSDWGKESGWTIGGGLATYDAVSTAQDLYQSISLASGSVYLLSFDISNVAVGKRAYFRIAGDLTGTPTYAPYSYYDEGSHQLVLPAGSYGGSIDFTALNSGDGGAFSIDNVSVKEVIFDTSDGDLILFNHPNNIPRIEYDANGNLLGLLVEESRTNLVTYSDLSSAWTEFNATKTISSVEAPNGDLMYELNATATGVPTGTVTTYSSTSGTYTVSAILKAGTTNYAFIGISDNATGQAEIRFNLSSGTYDTTNVGFVGSWTNISGSIVDLGNGFYRCSTTGTQGAGNPVSSRIIAGAPDGSRPQTVINTKLYATGAQLEAGSFMTSLIPTSGSTATRSADVASLSTSAFGYNQDEGTLYVEYVGTQDTFAGISALQKASSDVSNRISLIQTSATTIESVISNNGVTQSQQFESSVSAGNLSKAAIAFKTNRADSSFDGSVETTDTSVAVPDEIGFLRIAGYSSSFELNSHIKVLKYYPRALTAEQIQELTS